MATPGVIPTDANRDTVVRLHRQTRDHRHLWYQLTVLQQPERARACGAGTKANSDRRPVDPPPVVELRIKEGASFEEGKEITFDYNASFFLYASLEQHRKIATGRLATQPNPPILTGVPASGMAYLDRPAAAGYFIFPDLSVRHEGQYRLSFSLFETTKEEKDFDLEPAENSMQAGVDWRMEIKTAPFDVYSAKKFPGLMESTPLSKEVADQGCRVRIRRDVRMRKREGKSNNHDRRDEDFSRRRNVTPASEDPHSAAARARSLSNSSEHRIPYPGEPQPRPVDSYHPPPPPPPPTAYDHSNRHLAFGSDHGVPQYAAPRSWSHQPLAPVSPGGPYTPSSQHVKPDPQPYAYPPSRVPPPPSHSPALRHEGHDRRRSGPYASPSPTIYSPADAHMRRDSHHSSYPSTPITAQPPPPRMHTLPALQPPSQPRPQSPMHSQYRDYRNYRPSYNSLAPIEPQTEPLPEPAPISTGDKRKRDDVFPQNFLRPLHNGQRQDLHEESRRGFSPEPGVGQFERADGTVQHVTWPKYTWDP